MGAENSILAEHEIEELGDPLLDATSTKLNAPKWNIYPAYTKSDNTLTVFSTKKDASPTDRLLLEKLTRKLRILRHPNIVHYLSGGDESEGFYLVTEEVTPLVLILKSMTANEICAGLHDVLEAIVFLHEQAFVCHNNISLVNVFVAANGSWQLGGLEHACRFTDVNTEILEMARSYRDDIYVPPEEKEGKLDSSPERYHTRDAYAFGVLAVQLLEQMSDLGMPGDKLKSLEICTHGRLLNVDPKQRPKLSEVLGDRIFSSDSIVIPKFLKNVTMKTAEEKKKFFSTLVAKLLDLPEVFIAKRLTKLLLSRFVMLEETARQTVIPCLLTPCFANTRPVCVPKGDIAPLLTVPYFEKYVIPELYTIFHIRDCTIRLALLKYFSRYASLFNKEELQADIFPQILTGLCDSSEEIVVATLRALADLVPLLGAEIVIGRQRAHFFVNGKPKVTSPHALTMTSVIKEVIRDSQRPPKHKIPSRPRGKTDEEKEELRKERERKREAQKIRRQHRQQVRTQRQSDDTMSDQPDDTGDIHMCGGQGDRHRRRSDNVVSDEPDKDPESPIPMMTNGNETNTRLYHSSPPIIHPAEEDDTAGWSDMDNSHNLYEHNDTPSAEQEEDSSSENCDSDTEDSAVSEESNSETDDPPIRNISVSQQPYISSAHNEYSNSDRSISTSISSNGADTMKKLDPRPKGKLKGKMILGVPKTAKNKQQIELNQLSSAEDRQHGWNDVSVNVRREGKHPKHPAHRSVDSKSSSATSKHAHTGKTPKSPKALGSEYDIKELKIKPSKQSPQLDIFADMKSNIETQTNTADVFNNWKELQIQELSQNIAGESNSEKHMRNTRKLSMEQKPVPDATDGWDDDLDWGNDEEF